MHAFLITNSQEPIVEQEVEKIAREEEIKKIIPFTLQKIDDVRELKRTTKFTFSEKTAFLIENIDNATTESLNAFLKNLEEPNKNLFYILTASNLNNVLPTIVSRCEVLQVTGLPARQVIDKNIKQFLDAGTKQRVEIVDKIKDRGEAVKFVEDLIFFDHDSNNFKNQESYIEALKALKANGNVSLQLLNLVVKMNLAYGKE